MFLFLLWAVVNAVSSHFMKKALHCLPLNIFVIFNIFRMQCNIFVENKNLSCSRSFWLLSFLLFLVTKMAYLTINNSQKHHEDDVFVLLTNNCSGWHYGATTVLSNNLSKSEHNSWQTVQQNWLWFHNHKSHRVFKQICMKCKSK